MASTKRDYYEVLEIDRTADGETITKAYRKLAMREKVKEKGKGKNANGKGVDAIFSRLDTNGDGYLSLEEFKKVSELRQKKKDK